MALFHGDALTGLIVDPSNHFRFLIKSVLHSFGFKTLEEAPDAVSALNIMQGFQPSVLFVELELKGLNGFEFLDMIRTAKDIENHDIPFFMISSAADKSNVMEAAQKGADAFLVKPLRAIDLTKHLSSVLSGYRPVYKRWMQKKKQFGPRSEVVEL